MNNEELKHYIVVRLKNNILSNNLAYNLKYDIAYKVAAILYDAHFDNSKDLLKENVELLEYAIISSKLIEESQVQTLIDRLVSQYRDYYFDKLVSGFRAVQNGFAFDDDNISLYGKSHRAVGANSTIYTIETREILQMRKDFEKTMQSNFKTG
jgi:hypothetical protein